MSFNKYNPIHIIKGKKTLQDQEVVKSFINEKESFKRLKLSLFMYIIPFFYLYLVLIILGDYESEYRVLFYLPSLLIYISIKHKRVIYERYLIDICYARKNESKDVK